MEVRGGVKWTYLSTTRTTTVHGCVKEEETQGSTWISKDGTIIPSTSVSWFNFPLSICVHLLSSHFKPVIVFFNSLIRSTTKSSTGTGTPFLRFLTLPCQEPVSVSSICVSSPSTSCSLVSPGFASVLSSNLSPGNPGCGRKKGRKGKNVTLKLIYRRTAE